MVDAVYQFTGEYHFLSNFSAVNIDVGGFIVPSVEHAYQGAKATCVEDAQKVYHAATPGQAKRAGRLITCRQDWDTVRVGFMSLYVEQKFTHEPQLREKLLATGTAKLYEGNHWGDTFWGVDLTTFQGQNVLGNILMDVRSKVSLL